ncbi:cation:proton antiporter [Aquimarina sp. U1-2]|uniref:cation:proton antiporter n=1 Tax=Aquimarina sp. U1-2 TaxID=2823141 RepID=UPI001AEC8EDE|nr:cation:proton antiporter [Aquimarina sp. U1-2]MBP2831228.1 cation:proton antiporter [Aquimarina sp. U1-2]
MEIHILLNIFILFGVTTVIIVFCNFLKIPHLIGYLATGILLSPNTSEIMNSAHEVETYAEIGVILLLFTVGLEFSFGNLKKIKKFVLLGGTLQVLLTISITAVLTYCIGRTIEESIFWGFVTALSSTAIVVKILQDQSKLETQTGKVILAMLLFQDIVIVPFMLFTPILAGEGRSPVLEMGLLLLELGAIALLAWILAKYVIPKFLSLVMRKPSQEVFLVASIFIVTGIALFTSWLGLSLALGAFIAGLIIAETEYSRLAVSSFMPFRYVFIGFFFIAMGMLLDYHTFLEQFPRILFWFSFIVIVKIIAGTLAARFLKMPLKVSFAVGLSLAQIGEFSFVISKTGQEYGLITETNYQIFLAVSILTMSLAPFILNNLEIISQSFTRWRTAKDDKVQNKVKETLKIN